MGIAKATLELSNGINPNTDAISYFEFNNITAGVYTLTVIKEGYLMIAQKISNRRRARPAEGVV
jgi:hypothetical protein